MELMLSDCTTPSSSLSQSPVPQHSTVLKVFSCSSVSAAVIVHEKVTLEQIAEEDEGGRESVWAEGETGTKTD